MTALTIAPFALTASSTLGEVVAERPTLARVFEKLGIDYCCGGKQTLEQACRGRGLDVATVIAILEASDMREVASGEKPIDVLNMSLTELADHVQHTHHAYLKRELPRLQPLIERIALKHHDKNPKIVQLPVVYSAFRLEMEQHMAKEEHVLFPLIRRIDSAAANGERALGGIAGPIEAMEAEHQHAGDALGAMRQLTDDFSTPAAACNTYRGAMQGLKELEADLHQHVHKENNVLFPRVIGQAFTNPDKN